MEKSFCKVVIVGAGTMGLQIGLQIAAHEVPVVLVDTNLETVQRILDQQASAYLTATVDLKESVRDCDLVIECIPEKLRTKQNFFKRLEQIAQADTVLATNSSMLLPSKIAKKLKRKNRFCAFHFYFPGLGANIVDVSPIRQTTPDVTERLVHFARLTGFEPVRVKKENIGYIYNSIFDGINGKAISLVIRGIASIEDVDRSFRTNTQSPKGPFEMMDIVGLDVVLQIVKNSIWRKPLNLFGILFLNRYVKAGKLGVKTGEGFYRYERSTS